MVAAVANGYSDGMAGAFVATAVRPAHVVSPQRFSRCA